MPPASKAGELGEVEEELRPVNDRVNTHRKAGVALGASPLITDQVSQPLAPESDVDARLITSIFGALAITGFVIWGKSLNSCESQFCQLLIKN